VNKINELSYFILKVGKMNMDV